STSTASWVWLKRSARSARRIRPRRPLGRDDSGPAMRKRRRGELFVETCIAGTLPGPPGRRQCMSSRGAIAFTGHAEARDRAGSDREGAGAGAGEHQLGLAEHLVVVAGAI